MADFISSARASRGGVEKAGTHKKYRLVWSRSTRWLQSIKLLDDEYLICKRDYVIVT
jgi:hypothetical protein